MLTVKKAVQIIEVREQIQEDIRTFMLAFPDDYDDGDVKATADYMTDALCDLVVSNFKKFEVDPECGMRLHSMVALEKVWKDKHPNKFLYGEGQDNN